MGGLRRFIKPPESLERSLELSRHRCRKRTQKRPNYKNLGEEEDDERAAGGGGGSVEQGGEENWEDNSRPREREKGKGIEGGGGGSSKGSRASGETAEGECVSLDPAIQDCVLLSFTPITQTQSAMMHLGYPTITTAAALVSKQKKRINSEESNSSSDMDPKDSKRGVSSGLRKRNAIYHQ